MRPADGERVSDAWLAHHFLKWGRWAIALESGDEIPTPVLPPLSSSTAQDLHKAIVSRHKTRLRTAISKCRNDIPWETVLCDAQGFSVWCMMQRAEALLKDLEESNGSEVSLLDSGRRASMLTNQDGTPSFSNAKPRNASATDNLSGELPEPTTSPSAKNGGRSLPIKGKCRDSAHASSRHSCMSSDVDNETRDEKADHALNMSSSSNYNKNNGKGNRTSGSGASRPRQQPLVPPLRLSQAQAINPNANDPVPTLGKKRHCQCDSCAIM